jgi:hypothetical protein
MLIRLAMLLFVGALVLGCAELNGRTQHWIDNGCVNKEVVEQTYVCVEDEYAVVVRLEF